MSDPTCYYDDNEACGGELWQCKTCGQWFCENHWHETDLGRNVECVACERARRSNIHIDESSYSPADALDIKISGDCKTLREELVARTANAADIPEEARDIWTGDVSFVDGSYVVTLYYDKDSVQKEQEAV